MKPNAPILALLLSLSIPAHAGTTLDFLEIGFGAVSSGMGQAGVAESGNVEGVWHNPASLAALGGLYFTGSINPYLGMTLWSAAAVMKRGPYFAFAVSGSGLTSDPLMGDIRYSGDSGRTLNTGVAGGGLSVALALGNAARLPFRLDLGLKGKVVVESLDQTTLSALLWDAGAGLAFPGVFAKDASLQFGFVARNAGHGGVAGQPDVIPLSLLAGMAYVLPIGKKFSLKAMVDGDLLVPDQTVRVSTGMEVFLLNFLALRGGYLFDHGDSARGMTFGVGLRLGIADFDGQIDYALQPLVGLGFQQHFQLSLAWKTPP